MKTLAVLSALATIVVAVPAHEEYTDSTRFSPRDFTIVQQRNKKAAPIETLTKKIPDQLEDHESEQTGARSFGGFKKPVMVKKKVGVHLYRDSEEEQSLPSPQEDYEKQIKEKLCDDNNKMKSSSMDQTPKEISESEMEHNINIAKEAVQTFERDLHKMERDCSENNKHRHTSLGSDIQLHDDIEKARQALEHIHKKFKSLDPATATLDKSASKIDLKTLKSDEDRRNQWKQAEHFQNDHEIARNLEDNFKITEHNDGQFKANSFNEIKKDFKNVEQTDGLPSSNNKLENSIISIAEDKEPKMKIQSDNLLKVNTDIAKGQHTEEKISRMDDHIKEKKTMTEKNADLNNHEGTKQNKDLRENKEQTMDNDGIHLKFVEPKENDLKLLEQHTRNNLVNNGLFKLTDDSTIFNEQARTKVENELQNGHIQLVPENDQVTHANQNIETVLGTDSKRTGRFHEIESTKEGVLEHTDKNNVHLTDDTFELRTSLRKDTEVKSAGQEHLANEVSKNVIPRIDQQLSTQIQVMSKSDEHNLNNNDPINMETQRSLPSATVSNLNKEIGEKTHFQNPADNQESEHLRATSNSQNELLNNMDFIEDSHHMDLHDAFLSEHMMNKGKQELHERLNVPGVKSNSEHLKSMMHLSDNTHQGSPNQKMASIFNNEHPDFNVQFNAPKDFIQQTNIQEVLPFRSSSGSHDKAALDEKTNTLLNNEAMPIELHDPIKTRWAHPDNMRMDGSSQHFSIEKLPTSGGNLINEQHFHEQAIAQQRCAQAKSMNAHQLLPMNTGFDHSHAHNTFVSRNSGHNIMMAEKSRVGNNIPPSSFTHMHGAPKMALENTNPNQHAHNQGVFRHSYGPNIPNFEGRSAYGGSYGGGPSYGSSYGGGSSFSGSYGGGSASAGSTVTVSASGGSAAAASASGGFAAGGSALGGYAAGGSASGGSAVGIFPIGNIENHAIPLLLSCSPSVVSGSLAKTQHGYSAPSYRSDEMNFHKKRGVDMKELTSALKLPSGTVGGHRPIVILENDKRSV